MHKNLFSIRILMLGVIAAVSVCMKSSAENPIIQTKYTADPAPMVYRDTVFLYTSHDEDDAIGFKMFNWMLYTSTDMVNWTDHGIIAPLSMFRWAAANGAWAPQCIFRNGKFYMYCPVAQKNGAMAIGVAVSDSPYGPFADALGKPLIANSSDDIDPTVFIDDDGQAYLYWGNPNCYYVKLNEDMISYSGGLVKIDSRPKNYQEGPWFWKHQGFYYLAYASTCCPEGIGYAMSKSPTGPWTYKGMIMDPNSASSGNHPGIIEYKGRSYAFGFNYAILFAQTSTHYERRSICVEEMTYNADGTIKQLPWWSKSGAPQIGRLNPFRRTEAETIGWESGVEIEKKSADDLYVTDIDDGDYIKVIGVDFGARGAGVLHARVASGSNGGTIEVRLDSVQGEKISMLPVSYTGGWNAWKEQAAAVGRVAGVHDLFFVFRGVKGEKLFNVDSWKFDERTPNRDLAAVSASISQYKIDTVLAMNTLPLRATAIYSDGSFEDVSASARVEPGRTGIVTARNGFVTGIGYGQEKLTVGYHQYTDTLRVLVRDYHREHTVERITAEIDTLLLYPQGNAVVVVTAYYQDGHTDVITHSASYASSDVRVTTAAQGKIAGVSNGTAIVTIGYCDELGHPLSAAIRVRVTNRNPYARNNADGFTEQLGIQTEPCYDGDETPAIGYIQNNDWVKITALDFGAGAASFEARAASASGGGKIELRLDTLTGPVIGVCSVTRTGGWQNWQTTSCPVTGVSGKHDLVLKFTGDDGFLFNLHWWQFSARKE